MLEIDGYRVAHPEEIETPALLVFEDRLAHNIKTVIDLAGSPANLMAHVKTHKSAEVLRRQMAAEISRFKTATLTETEMVAAAGGSQALLAYPLVSRVKIDRFISLQKKYARTRFQLIAAHPENAALLSAVAVKNGVRLEVMVDLDVGHHRTGATIREAEALYGKIAASPGLVPAGIHAYDGHVSDPDPALRESEARACLEQVQTLARRLDARGLAVPFKVMGSSFTFPTYARAEGILASPGTWIYWDQNNLTHLPEMPFRPAALVLAQVIDMMPERGQVTLDLGSKAISTDMNRQERFCILGAPQARLLLHNEEHAVIATEGHDLKLGDYVLAVPGHVCTTVFLYQGSWFIDASGNVTSWNEHTATRLSPLSSGRPLN